MRASQEHVNQKQQKVLLVIIPNAVVHPGAVVIHSGYAPTAYRAVMRCRWLNAVALFALLIHQIIKKFNTTRIILYCIVRNGGLGHPENSVE